MRLVDAGVIDTLAPWAFRYALGRMTYVVGEVCRVLEAYSDHLSPQTRRLIIEEITEAERRGGLGMEMDAKQWQRLRGALARYNDQA